MNPLSENTAKMQRGRPFVKGQSGNPDGRPKGTRNRATIAAETLFDGQAEALTQKAIDMALAGDSVALRLCLERLIPPRKSRAVQLELPRIERDEDATAANMVLAAVANGEITLAEGRDALAMIETCRCAILAADDRPHVGANIRISFVGVK